MALEQQNNISDSGSVEELKTRVKAFRHLLYGRTPEHASSNGHMLAWCDGVDFAIRQMEKLQNPSSPTPTVSKSGSEYASGDESKSQS